MSQYNSSVKRYPVDVRLFLASVTIGMALSFGLGVFFGPSPSLESLEVFQSRNSLSTTSPPPQDSTTPDFKEQIKGSKRLPTQHLADLGIKVDEDGNDSPDHQPAGQHLLVDMKNIEADFLNSEPRLTNAMVEAVKAGGLTLLSYHCHTLIPAGVSCVGVLLESHISFHTWPDEGVITLDLFTCGESPLVPVVPVLEKLFGIPRINAETGLLETIETLWSHELRGFRKREDRQNHYLDLQSDLGLWITSPLDTQYKKEIVSVQTPYQRVDIWDVKDRDDTPSHSDGMKHGLSREDPRWLTSEVASPERHLFVNGTLQSLSHSEREFHETLVQPAMFAHPNPISVAVLGGGEGAALREVLKHNTVKHVKMIDIDEMFVDIAKEHLKTFSDCSDLVGSTDSCFDDPRVELIFQDARKYFVDNYGPGKKLAEFDVVIVDNNLRDDYNGGDNFYDDKSFIASLYASLTDDGVIGTQIGTAPNIHDPRADMGVYSNREVMFNMIENDPATAVMSVYEESHCGFLEPIAFMVMCKSTKCRQEWYAPTDVTDYSIYNRVKKSKSGERTLVHYDGSTQHSFKFPPKAWETVYCRREPTPVECAFIHIPIKALLFDVDHEDASKSSFTLELKDDGKSAVFANVDMPKGSYIMPTDLASSFLISDSSVKELQQHSEIDGTPAPVLQNFVQFVEDNGHASLTEGSASNIVEIGASHLIRKVDKEEDANVGRLLPSDVKRPVYSPVYDRHRLSFDVFLVAKRDIKAGEEITKYVNTWQ